MNIHEPRAPVAVVILHPGRHETSRRTEIREGTSGAAAKPGHEGMEFLSSFRNEGGLARAETFWQGSKPMLITMTPAKMCLAPIVAMNREADARNILRAREK